MENLSSELYTTFSPNPIPAINFLAWLKEAYGWCGEINLLDIGCGPGKSLPQYAELGWSVVGMEPDSKFYAEAVALTENNPQIEVRQGGFQEIDDAARFHLIAAINGPFAYLLDPETRLEALERCFQALKPGGILFLDLPNLLWFLKNNPEPPKWRKTVEGKEAWLLEHYHYDLHDALFIQLNDYLIKEPDGTETCFHKTDRHAIIAFPEVARQLDWCGFIKIRTYNSFEARQSERLTGRRMMISAQKPNGFYE